MDSSAYSALKSSLYKLCTCISHSRKRPAPVALFVLPKGVHLWELRLTVSKAPDTLGDFICLSWRSACVCPLLRWRISLAILIAATSDQNRRYLAYQISAIKFASDRQVCPLLQLKSSLANYSTKQISRFPRMPWDRIIRKIAGKIAKCAAARSDEIRWRFLLVIKFAAMSGY